MDETTPPETPPVPPGEHQHDPYRSDLDPILWQVERTMTHVNWVGEHHSTIMAEEPVRVFFAGAGGSPLVREELDNLRRSLEGAHQHVYRLAELLLAGYTPDHEKQVPPTLPQCLRRWREREGA